MKGFRVLAIVTAVAVYGQIVLGGVVRITVSGLGCPDWPLCYGQLLPRLEYHTLIEYFHRLLGTAAGLLVLATVVCAVALWAGRVPAAARQAGTARGATDSAPGASARFATMLIASAVGTYLIVVSGAYVVGRGAGSACAAWPLCGSARTDLADVHFLHRVVVGVAGLLLLGTLHLARRRWSGTSMVVVVYGTALALLLEVGVGAAQVLLRLPASLRAIHVALATAVWAGVTLQVAAMALESRGERAAARAARSGTPRGAEPGVAQPAETAG
ncbi:MAG TPA: COX15/CtaA family protein [Candidatus Dormibacteraeota bacterium]|nr:COX15/CtaA family protein [Candidatus Dormibacteraeota bacterium]